MEIVLVQTEVTDVQLNEDGDIVLVLHIPVIPQTADAVKDVLLRRQANAMYCTVLTAEIKKDTP